ncbi:hypothetical protein K435DRAFT_835413 [Dendrothele bispora CBS 962.96]|uniref:Uncharacterized protein n=1 Tax=Dendrothele bispora (strain CBS 962.96) TaxID=1314807 RepID=A0A4S8MPS3_DENBC|nr:hypothetical protein K435DRAFT_835413 [Dendrothele bispora CBS 962.96]
MPNLQNNLQKSAHVTILGFCSMLIIVISNSAQIQQDDSIRRPSFLSVISEHNFIRRCIKLRPRLTDTDDGDSKLRRIPQRRLGEVDPEAKKGAEKGLRNNFSGAFWAIFNS